MSEPESTPPVIFNWADREGSSWWLAAFIFLSFLLHSAAFFVLQGKDPLPTHAARTAPAVQILSASSDPATRSPEANALLEWIATQDPALIARIQTVEPRGLTGVPYRPSFHTVRTQPLAAPPEPPTIQFPAARDPFALIRSMSPETKAAPPEIPPQTTHVTASSSLQERLPRNFAPVPQAKAATTVQPTVVLIALSAKGETRYTFLQQSSGSPELDSEAAAIARASRFAPGSEEMQWGTLTFTWGDDVLRQPGDPTATPK